uniref:Congested-like trachea protein n=1 Tax=Meloidogyne hapla TaxID=6305 RepID=A0A1I8BNR9_MELHA
MSETNFVLNFISGGVGGCCAVIVGHPFDTVKVRLQTMPRPINGQKPLYTGAMDCARQTVTKEGFFALYKGMAAPLVGVSPLFAVFFGGTAVGKWLLQKDPNKKLTFSQNFTADGPVDVVKKLYKEGGIKSIYRGTGATLLRDIPASGAYISVYEYLKAKFSGEQGKLTPMTTLMAGGFAGIANWSVCIPADVMKSRLQTAPEGKYPDGIRGVFREIMREEGPRALFRGFAPVMLRAFPANAACFSGLELTLWLFRNLHLG